jgi:hypothetical protein
MRWPLVSVIALLAAALTPPFTRDAARAAACGHADVEVGGATPREAADLCAALSEVRGYFGAMGFQWEPTGSVAFLARGDPTSSRAGHVHGYFDRRQSAVVLFREPVASPWRLGWSDELAASFLRHELVHMALWQILRDAAPMRLRREWHEFIAYAVQFALMSPQLRDQVLASDPDALAFEQLDGVNEFIAGMVPERFAISAYRTYVERDGARFVAQLLRFEIRPPPMSYPFPVLPGQIPED